eukprot:926893-Pyramimonas_sp.AAC.1
MSSNLLTAKHVADINVACTGDTIYKYVKCVEDTFGRQCYCGPRRIHQAAPSYTTTLALRHPGWLQTCSSASEARWRMH